MELSWESNGYNVLYIITNIMIIYTGLCAGGAFLYIHILHIILSIKYTWLVDTILMQYIDYMLNLGTMN